MMVTKISYLAVTLAALASFVFGGVYYGLMSKAWISALGRSAAELEARARPMPVLFAITIAAELAMAYALAGIIGHIGGDHIRLATGLIAGLAVWLGFIVPALVVNYSYQGQQASLIAIDAMHWAGVLLIQALIIAWLSAA